VELARIEPAQRHGQARPAALPLGREEQGELQAHDARARDLPDRLLDPRARMHMKLIVQ
jgi:hypothetical protein